MLRHLKLKKKIKITIINGCLSAWMMISYQKNIQPFRLNWRLIQVWFKIEDLKNIELNALPVYNDRYIKIKIRTYGDKVYTNFRGLNVSEDDMECESLTVISVDCLLVYENKSPASIFT